MRVIDSITADAKQNFRLIGEGGQRIPFKLYYLPSQQCWAYDISYNGKVSNGNILVAGANIIRNFRNIWDFGLAVISNDGLDPFYIDDFTSGRIIMYLLNQPEVDLIETVFE